MVWGSTQGDKSELYQGDRGGPVEANRCSGKHTSPSPDDDKLHALVVQVVDCTESPGSQCGREMDTQ